MDVNELLCLGGDAPQRLFLSDDYNAMFRRALKFRVVFEGPSTPLVTGITLTGEATLLQDGCLLHANATGKAEEAVLDAYKPEQFLLTKNIFMPDTWKSPIPDVSVYSGTGMGKLGITDVDRNRYTKIMAPIIEKYNVNEAGKKVWNGYLILPIISFILSVLSTKLIKPPEQPQMAGQTEEQLKAQQSQAKMMTYLMPLMMGVFALFYSTAFTLYMVVSNVFTTLFNLIFNIVSKQLDAKRKDEMLARTVKK